MGLGGFSGPPFVWSAIVEGTVTRVVRAPGISDEALLDVDAVFSRGLGAIVTRDDAWSGTLDASAGYRGGDTTSDLAEQVRALLAELDATSIGRARGHKLEIKRAAAYTVTLGDGRAFTLWGPPAKVSPPDALDAPGRALLRNLGLLAIGFFVALVLMWLTRHGR